MRCIKIYIIKQKLYSQTHSMKQNAQIHAYEREDEKKEKESINILHIYLDILHEFEWIQKKKY